MHCCISVLGYTASIAFVKPVNPSMQAISISSTLRAFMLFSTESQNFALSFSPTHIPRTSFCPSILIPIAIYTAFLMICPSLLTWKCIASINTTAYISSSGLDCHSRTTGSILSVIRLIVVSEHSKP